LGVCLAPTRNNKTEYEYCLKEATKLQPRLLHTPMNRESTRTGFTTMILQKFKYPLGATCFSEKECSSILSKFLPSVLSKMGINCSTPTEVCLGPMSFASMEVPELWTIQGFSKNELMIGNLRKSNLVGDNLQVKLDCLQLQAGTSWNVLSHNGALVHSSVDHCWATHLWEFNDRYNLTIHQEDCPWLLPQ
jgi:hypothetical protein